MPLSRYGGRSAQERDNNNDNSGRHGTSHTISFCEVSACKAGYHYHENLSKMRVGRAKSLSRPHAQSVTRGRFDTPHEDDFETTERPSGGF